MPMPYTTFPQPWCHELPHPLPCTQHLPLPPPAPWQGFAPAEGQKGERGPINNPKAGGVHSQRGEETPVHTHGENGC